MGAPSTLSYAKQSVGWSIALGVLLIVAGLLAIASPAAAGIAVNLVVAWLLVFSGCAHLAFAWFRRSGGGFFWELLLGIVYLFIGGYMLVHPAVGLASLTIALAIYLIVEAVLEFVMGITLRPLSGSGWLIFDGIVTLILAVLIWRTWPSSSDWVIGTLVGISMLFSGITRLAMSLAARRLVNKVPA
ncbi:MAG TPA: HdeD family acid-resistance protein [Terriglobales bacterium]|nr:HdeD family acid-resistance protein [Terriglobales bacterium]